MVTEEVNGSEGRDFSLANYINITKRPDPDLVYVSKLLELLILETVTANGFSKQSVRQAEKRIRSAHREAYGFDQPSSEQLDLIFEELDKPNDEKTSIRQ